MMFPLFHIIMKYLLLLAFLFVGLAYPTKVLLRDVQVLTFNAGQMTTSRRSAPMYQLSCTNCNTHNNHIVKSVQCRNVGWDGNDVNWKCESNLPNEWELGQTTVCCEGFDYPDDPHVLVGSCGLEYQLTRNHHYVPTHVYHQTSKNDSFLVAFQLLAFVMFPIGILYLLVLCSPKTTHTTVTTTHVEPQRTSTAETSIFSSDASIYQTSPMPSAPMAPSRQTTTHVEHHYHDSKPGYSEGLATGCVLGSFNEAARRHLVTPVVPTAPIIIQPVKPVVVQSTVKSVTPSDPTNDHTSTSYATTKRR
jgi:hypothetical protein